MGLVLLGVVIGAVLALGAVLVWRESEEAEKFGRALEGMRRFDKGQDPYDQDAEIDLPLVRVRKR